MKTDIEKTWNFNIDGFEFNIRRNKRKDVFLSDINRGCFTLTSKKTVFMTLKGAKQEALKLIEIHKSNLSKTF